jgi:hypothetical protein
LRQGSYPLFLRIQELLFAQCSYLFRRRLKTPTNSEKELAGQRASDRRERALTSLQGSEMKGGWTENELKRNAKWSKSKAKSKPRIVGTTGLAWGAEVRLEGDESR